MSSQREIDQTSGAGRLVSSESEEEIVEDINEEKVVEEVKNSQEKDDSKETPDIIEKKPKSEEQKQKGPIKDVDDNDAEEQMTLF